MNSQFLYNLHGLVNVKSNTNYLEPFLGFFKTEQLEDSLKSSVVVELKKSIEDKTGKSKRMGIFSHVESVDGIYFEQPFLAPVQLLVKNIEKGEVTVQVTPFFLRLPTFLKGGINFSYLFREILLLKLLEENHLLLHAACVEIGDCGVLLPAFPNSGKTNASFRLVRETDAKFLSDEYVIVNSDGEMLAFPSACAIHSKLIKKLNISLSTNQIINLSVKKILARLLPLLYESIIWIPSYKIIDNKKIVTKTHVRFVVFLERGPTKIVEVDRESAIKKLSIMTQHEFPICSNPVFQVYSYVNDMFDFGAYLSKERKIISNVIRKADRCLIVSSEGKHFELLSALMKRNFFIRERNEVDLTKNLAGLQ